MEINITLVLQVMQFMCVYYFLYTFLFVPACKILDEQAEYKNNLYKNLECQQQVKDELLQDAHVKKDAFKAVLLQEVSDNAVRSVRQVSTFGLVLNNVEKTQLSEENKQEAQAFLVDQLSRIIKK